MSVQPLPSPAYYPHATLTKPKEYPGVFLRELQNRPDNRLSNEFILDTLMPALSDVEREYRASRANDLAEAPAGSDGWTKPNSAGEYALVTCGPRDKNRFYSNGLNLESVAETDGFFQHILGPLYSRLLTFPIPTVCALNGHAYAGGFCLALCHDHRVMKEGEAKGRATMAMNEVEFGAYVPHLLVTILQAKMPSKDWVRKTLTNAHRLKLGIVDKLAPEDKVVDEACKHAASFANRATTGVYGTIKAFIYKDNVETIAQSEGFTSTSFEEDYRRMKLGEEYAAKSKL